MKQAEDQLRQLLDLKYQQEKDQYGKELIAKKEVKVVERENETRIELRSSDRVQRTRSESVGEIATTIGRRAPKRDRAD